MTLRSVAGPALRSATKATAAAVDTARPPATGITILIYHRIGSGTGGQMDIHVGEFDRQIEWLRSTQRVLTLDRAVEELRGVEPVQPGVVVTFDDGTVDWVDRALPVLDRHGVPATFYVATDFVEQRRAFPADGTPISWAGLKELATSSLVTLGSHTHRHTLMDRVPVPDIAEELDRSIQLIGERVGIDAEHFCYPKALLGSPPAQAAIRERFRSATLAGTRANQLGADPYRLARSPIQAADGQRWFRRKAVGGLGFEDRVRDGLNALRYRGATE